MDGKIVVFLFVIRRFKSYVKFCESVQYLLVDVVVGLQWDCPCRLAGKLLSIAGTQLRVNC